MNRSFMLRCALAALLTAAAGQAAFGQERSEQPQEKPKVWTNLDFGVSSSPSSVPTPPPTPPTVETQPAPTDSQPPTEPEKQAEEVIPDRAELKVVRDANGNWILSSVTVPGSTRKINVEALKVSTGKPELDQLIEEAGKKHGVDPRLILEVMRQESGFKQYATSPAGAKGLMQFIPGTAKRYGITNAYDPKQSIDAGARYLRDLLDMFNGNVELALAGYNAGEHRVVRNGYRVPQIRETQNYVRTITQKYGRKNHTTTRTLAKKEEPPKAAPMRVERDAEGRVLLTNH